VKVTKSVVTDDGMKISVPGPDPSDKSHSSFTVSGTFESPYSSQRSYLSNKWPGHVDEIHGIEEVLAVFGCSSKAASIDSSFISS
jgi:hypothetical protein